jgi:hypothetical protein
VVATGNLVSLQGKTIRRGTYGTLCVNHKKPCPMKIASNCYKAALLKIKWDGIPGPQLHRRRQKIFIEKN